MSGGAMFSLSLAGALIAVAFRAGAADDPLAGATKAYERYRYEQAARAFEELLPRLDAARRAQSQLMLGTVYLRNADLHEAFGRTAAAVQFDYLDKLVRTGAEGRSRYARFFLAEGMLARGNGAEAALHFERWRSEAGDDAGFSALASVGLGSVAWARRESERARSLWDVAGTSANVVLARAAAQADAGAGDIKALLRVADEAARRRDLSVRARRYVMEIYLGAGAPERALAMARAADFAAASFTETFRAAKGTSKSISFYDLALLKDMARLYRELARRHFELAATDVRMKPAAEYYLAELLIGLGRNDEAQRYVSSFLSQPQAPAQFRDRTRVRQALLNYRQGKRAEAAAGWNAVAEQGDDPEVLAEVAFACAEVAAECAQPMARLTQRAETGDGRRFRRLNFALGTYYLRRKDYARAITYMETGRDKSNKNKIEANDPEMLTALAEAYYRTKKFSEGLEIFFEMSKEFPVVRQIQEAMQGVYSVEQRSAGDVKIF